MSTLSLTVLLGWVAWGVLSAGLGLPLSLILGLAIGAICAIGLRSTLPVGVIMAVLDPIAIILPLLALRHMVAAIGVPVQPFGTAELVVFLLLYLTFLATAAGALPWQVYRLGYTPIPVALIALALCVVGLWQGALFLPLVAVSGQALWVLGWGSSNYFDHIVHAALVPVVIVVLILRLF
ncbi:hypothetical protein OO012_13645 [Rhodobacteraceae bacterium KMM 6894]|nr:hypothetical protein [Rhodobacteraceae bacterium KMM 6894]